MKKFTSLIVGAALLAMPMQPRAQVGPAIFCISITAVVVAGGVAIYVHSCKPQYYCVKDPDNNLQWCTVLNRGEAAVNGWQVLSGPYKDAEACDKSCHTNLLTRKISGPVTAQATTTLHIARSTNLVDWVECATLQCNPDDVFWGETNSVETAAVFYRAWY